MAPNLSKNTCNNLCCPKLGTRIFLKSNEWGLWCPPHKSVEEDSMHGHWWNLLPASVQNQEAFMSSLLYRSLLNDTVFPCGSCEHSAVQGCSANAAGYDAIYSLLRLQTHVCNQLSTLLPKFLASDVQKPSVSISIICMISWPESVLLAATIPKQKHWI